MHDEAFKEQKFQLLVTQTGGKGAAKSKMRSEAPDSLFTVIRVVL